MIKVLNNIKNKIINIFFEEVSETEHKEILNKDELNELRNKLGRLNITRLYEYDSLIMVFNSHDNAYKLINILNELWLESAGHFKYDYSIDKLCNILYDIRAII